MRKQQCGPYVGQTWVDFWEDGEGELEPICECGWPGFLCCSRWHEENDIYESDSQDWHEENDEEEWQENDIYEDEEA